MSDARKGGAGWKGKGWIEGVIAWYVGDEHIERAVRAVWNAFATRQVGRVPFIPPFPFDTNPITRLAGGHTHPHSLRRHYRITQGRECGMASDPSYRSTKLASRSVKHRRG
jgi:hypothetical protein